MIAEMPSRIENYARTLLGAIAFGVAALLFGWGGVFLSYAFIGEGDSAPSTYLVIGGTTVVIAIFFAFLGWSVLRPKRR